MSENSTVMELAKRLSGIALVSSDVTDEDIGFADIESLTAYVVDYFKDKGRPGVLNKAVIERIREIGRGDALPEASVEILGKKDFNPVAREGDLHFRIRNMRADKTTATVNDFARYFGDRLKKLKEIIHSGRNSKLGGMINSVENLGQYADSREVTVAGLVYEKRITKNGHVIVVIDDETGRAAILFAKPDKSSTQEFVNMFNEAQRIVVDEVIAVRGRLSASRNKENDRREEAFIVARYFARPDIPIHPRARPDEELGIAFLSDIHVGSKLFMEKHFNRFLEWINGDVDYKKDLAEKIRAVMIGGDLVDGIGVYPRQDRELMIDDIYKQYSVLFDYLDKIPDYIHIFILPGNHDAVHLAEPQPSLPKEFTSNLNPKNMHLLSNPGYVTLDRIRILSYHGCSLDSVIQGIPGCSYSKPEEAMVEVLKRRHISPIYGDNPIVPGKADPLVIDDVPDILHMGHLHKNGYAEYHGTLAVNSGTWQSRTSYQVKLGHIPTPAQLFVYEGKSAALSSVDFNYILE